MYDGINDGVYFGWVSDWKEMFLRRNWSFWRVFGIFLLGLLNFVLYMKCYVC